MSFLLIQLLIKQQGCFNVYLNRIGRSPSPGCGYFGPLRMQSEEVDPSCLRKNKSDFRLVGKIEKYNLEEIVASIMYLPGK